MLKPKYIVMTAVLASTITGCAMGPPPPPPDEANMADEMTEMTEMTSAIDAAKRAANEADYRAAQARLVADEALGLISKHLKMSKMKDMMK